MSTPAALVELEHEWHSVYPLGKPFSVHPLPWTDQEPWAADVEDRWMGFLERHPEAFDSLDVLDDLATATFLHPQADQPAIMERLTGPLLARSVAILERARATGRSGPALQLHWAMTPNRPALRALFRSHEHAMLNGRHDEARRIAEQLLALNPHDNHGLRFWLAGERLKSGDAEGCLRIAEAYPEDPAPELRFNAALALYRLGRARSATVALQAADRATPRVTPYLLEKRARRPRLSEHGVSLDGDDRGWLYRESMRSTWLAVPGAIEWARKVLRTGG